MAYYKQIWYLNNSIEIEEKFKGRYGAKGRKRNPKKKKATPEQIKKQNEWNAIKHLRRLLDANFLPDDFHTVLRYYKGEKPDAPSARQTLRKFLRIMRREYKKRGFQLKYIVVTEWGKNGIHHHIVINNIIAGKETTTSLVNKYWNGYNYFSPLHEDGEYQGLAEYLVKETKNTFRDDDNPNKSRYSRSRNLVIPEPENERMSYKEFADTPKVPKGYYLDKETLVEGENRVSKKKFRYYILKKLLTIKSKCG